MRPPIEPSHLDLCCLQKPIIIAYGSERDFISRKSLQRKDVNILTDFRLNKLPPTLYRTSRKSILSIYEVDIPREKWLIYLQTDETLICIRTVRQLSL